MGDNGIAKVGNGQGRKCNALEGTTEEFQAQADLLSRSQIAIAPSGPDHYCTYRYHGIDLGTYRPQSPYLTFFGAIENELKTSTFLYFPQETPQTSELAGKVFSAVAQYQQGSQSQGPVSLQRYYVVVSKESGVLGDYFDWSLINAFESFLRENQARILQTDAVELDRDERGMPKLYTYDVAGWDLPTFSFPVRLEKPAFEIKDCENWVWRKGEGEPISLPGWRARFFENGIVKGIPNESVRSQAEAYVNKQELYPLLFANDLDRSDWLKSKDPIRFRIGETKLEEGGVVGLECPVVIAQVAEQTGPKRDAQWPAQEKKKPSQIAKQAVKKAVPPPQPPGDPANQGLKPGFPDEFRRELAELVRHGGGRVQTFYLNLPEDSENKTPAQLIRERLPIPEKKKYYQIEIVVDASGSMSDNVRDIAEKTDPIFKEAFKQLKKGGMVSIGVRFYVDDIYGRNGQVVPLDSIRDLENPEQRADWIENIFNEVTEPEQAKEGLQKVAQRIQATGGVYEFHWEALMNAVKEEPWGASPDVEKVLFLITDEDDDGGLNLKQYSQKDVALEANKRGIRLEVIQLEDARDGFLPLGCFPSDSTLRLANGGMITFGEMMGLHQMREAFPGLGIEFPELLSYNEETGERVPQTPEALIPHLNHYSTLLYLSAETMEGEPVTLEVTDNHPMLIERDGTQMWEAAGQLQTGDLLIGPGETYYLFNREATVAEEGARDVFNLHFPKGNHPNYLVSEDGVHWFIAHNRKF